MYIHTGRRGYQHGMHGRITKKETCEELEEGKKSLNMYIYIYSN